MAVGKICQPLGVHGMQNTVCETLTDVLKNYLLTLGRTTASYSLHGERARASAVFYTPISSNSEVKVIYHICCNSSATTIEVPPSTGT